METDDIKPSGEETELDDYDELDYLDFVDYLEHDLLEEEHRSRKA
jgi:hypothetical protein